MYKALTSTGRNNRVQVLENLTGITSLSYEQKKFLNEKLQPLLGKCKGDDTITFTDGTRSIEEVQFRLRGIVRSGEYNESDKLFLTGLRLFYINFKDKI